VALAPAGVDIGLALNLSALSVGMALGAAVGGAVIEQGGLASLGHVGAAIIALALAGLVSQRAAGVGSRWRTTTVARRLAAGYQHTH
jgi:DHA1 family purine base/nucleoside efflux pump-like MFS transporter